MATTAHCAFCFEVLSAQFEKRQPLSLAQVEDLWESYESSNSKTEDLTQSGASEENVTENVTEDGSMTDKDTEPEEQARPAAISRLLNKGTESAGSSNSSLPSTPGSGSSTSIKGSATPASSKTSLDYTGKTRAREEYPLFVTWNQHSARSGQKSLRGCIGTFGAQELEGGLKSYALTRLVTMNRVLGLNQHSL
jgi:hypothetical protein